MTITAVSHPRIFALCVSMLLDNGAVNRAEPMPVAIRLPRLYDRVEQLRWADTMLMKLTAQERETLAIGEETEALLIAARYSLMTLSTILNGWFDEGMPCDRERVK